MNMNAWPEHDTAPCAREGEHLGMQRHPLTECPTYSEPDEGAEHPQFKVPTYEGEDYSTAAIYEGIMELFHTQGTQGVLMGDNPLGDNIKRAKFAAEAIRAYAMQTGVYSGEVILLAIGDLMNDLRHLLDYVALDEDSETTEGYSPDLETLAARDLHYQAEIRGEF